MRFYFVRFICWIVDLIFATHSHHSHTFRTFLCSNSILRTNNFLTKQQNQCANSHSNRYQKYSTDIFHSFALCLLHFSLLLTLVRKRGVGLFLLVNFMIKGCVHVLRLRNWIAGSPPSEMNVCGYRKTLLFDLPEIAWKYFEFSICLGINKKPVGPI